MTWLFHDGEKVFNLNYHTKSRQVELVKPRFDSRQWAYYPQSTDTWYVCQNIGLIDDAQPFPSVKTSSAVRQAEQSLPCLDILPFHLLADPWPLKDVSGQKVHLITQLYSTTLFFGSCILPAQIHQEVFLLYYYCEFCALFNVLRHNCFSRVNALKFKETEVRQAGKMLDTRSNWRISLWNKEPTIWQRAGDETGPLYCTGGV